MARYLRIVFPCTNVKYFVVIVLMAFVLILLIEKAGSYVEKDKFNVVCWADSHSIYGRL
jgi:energy-converting hydrogenase Eha subunit H